MRAANGHPEPYNVKQWELGNEVFGDWVRGHSTADAYAKAAVRYANAMKAVDPSIQLVAVGEGIMPEQESWNSTVLRIAGSVIDYLAIHDYTSSSQNSQAASPYAQVMARSGEFERSYQRTGELIAQLAPGRNVRQIVNEWNLFYDSRTIENMTGAVYASRMMNGFEREGSTVEANSISDLLNGWAGGVLQASRDRIYGTAQYYAVKLYADHLGTDRLELSTQSPELQSGVASIDALATRSTDGSRLFVKLSNADRERAIKTSISLKSFSHASLIALDMLKAPEPGVRNTFSDPETIIPARSTIECRETCSFEMPASSVAVLTFTHSAK